MVTTTHNHHAGSWAIRRWIRDGITDDAIMIVANQWRDSVLSGPYYTMGSIHYEIRNHMFGSEITIKELKKW